VEFTYGNTCITEVPNLKLHQKVPKLSNDSHQNSFDPSVKR